MHILVLADNYLPEIVATSFRISEHARRWLAEGHEVTVVTCAPNWPHGKVFDGYRNRLYQEEWVDGVRVIRVWSYMAPNRGFLRRTADYVSYLISVVAWSWRLPAFDVILATSPQFFTAVAGWAVSRIRRRPWVFEVRDLWPESIKAVGAADGRLIRRLERLELFLYRNCDGIVALTHAFRDHLTVRGIPAAKIEVVTNGVDCRRFHPDRAGLDARAALGVPADVHLVGYVGTTGMAHALETVVEAARCCDHRRDIQWMILGDGAERSRLEDLARRRGVTNLRFVDRVPHEQMPAYLRALDVSIIHLKDQPVFRTVIPSKLFECMAMQVPVLMAVEGEAAGIVRDTGCGLCIAPERPQAMADAIAALVDDPGRRREMGRRGMQAAQQSYRREVLADKVLHVLQDVAASERMANDHPRSLPQSRLLWRYWRG